MDNISVTELKTNPAKAIDMALDYPLPVANRNKVKAYLIGKELYEKIYSLIEDYIDKIAVEKTDFRKGNDFEKVAKELGL